MSSVISTLTAAVVAIFAAENNVQDKRNAAARAYRDAAREASKAQGKSFNLNKWHREQSTIAREALVDASPCAKEFRALDEKGRKEFATRHGKHDPLSRLIAQYGTVTVRFSEMKRLYLLDKAGDAIARGFFAGTYGINQALEMLANIYRPTSASETTEAIGEGSESEPDGDASSADKFRAALTMWATKAAKEGWVSDFANIMAEVAGRVHAALLDGERRYDPRGR